MNLASEGDPLGLTWIILDPLSASECSVPEMEEGMENSMMPMQRIAVSKSRCEYMCPGDDDEDAVGRLCAAGGSGGSWSFAAGNSLSNALYVLCKAIGLQDLSGTKTSRGDYVDFVHPHGAWKE